MRIINILVLSYQWWYEWLGQYLWRAIFLPVHVREIMFTSSLSMLMSISRTKFVKFERKYCCVQESNPSEPSCMTHIFLLFFTHNHSIIFFSAFCTSWLYIVYVTIVFFFIVHQFLFQQHLHLCHMSREPSATML